MFRLIMLLLQMQNGLVITQLLTDGTIVLSNGAHVAVGQKINFMEGS